MISCNYKNGNYNAHQLELVHRMGVRGRVHGRLLLSRPMMLFLWGNDKTATFVDTPIRAPWNNDSQKQ